MMTRSHPTSQFESSAVTSLDGNVSCRRLHHLRNSLRDWFSQISVTTSDVNRQLRNHIAVLDAHHRIHIRRGTFKQPRLLHQTVVLGVGFNIKSKIRFGRHSKKPRVIHQSSFQIR